MTDIRSQIENTLYRYAWTYDMDELDGIADCFTRDAQVEFRDSGLKIGRDAVTAELRRRRDKYTDGNIPWHIISNVFITEATESEATVRSCFAFFNHGPDGVRQLLSIGWYDDRFATEDEAWRIRRRRVRLPADR